MLPSDTEASQNSRTLTGAGWSGVGRGGAGWGGASFPFWELKDNPTHNKQEQREAVTLKDRTAPETEKLVFLFVLSH